MNDPGKIRNIALVGHRGTGKTSLLEALLFRGGVVNRLGKVEDGTTVSDWDDDEKKRELSLSATLAHIERGGLTLQPHRHPRRLELPGRHHRRSARWSRRPSWSSTACSASRCRPSVCGRGPTSAAWRASCSATCSTASAPTSAPPLASLKQAFGPQVVAVQLPIGSEHEFKGVVDLLTMKAYMLRGREVGRGRHPGRSRRPGRRGARQAHRGRRRDRRRAHREVPRGRGDRGRRAAAGVRGRRRPGQDLPGRRRLGDAPRRRRPLPRRAGPRAGARRRSPVPWSLAADGSETQLVCDPAKPAAAFVFKTMADPFSGQHQRVPRLPGHRQERQPGGRELATATRSASASCSSTRARRTSRSTSLVAGDIGAVAKLKDVVTGDSLCAEGAAVTFPAIQLPGASHVASPSRPRPRATRTRSSARLRRLAEEDPMMDVHRDPQTGETIVAGMSQVHVEVICERMKRRFGVEVELHPPRVPYRETIKPAPRRRAGTRSRPAAAASSATRGSRLQPHGARRGLRVRRQDRRRRHPAQLHPGRREGHRRGHARGLPRRLPGGRRARHPLRRLAPPVDSSEMAFKIAGSIGFKAAMEKAQPALLEPIMNGRGHACPRRTSATSSATSTRVAAACWA